MANIVLKTGQWYDLGKLVRVQKSKLNGVNIFQYVFEYGTLTTKKRF